MINGSQESVEGSELTTILLDIGNEAQTMIGKQSNISSSFFIVYLFLSLNVLESADANKPIVLNKYNRL